MVFMDNIRGVNLGGWLVLEKWISPSVFSGTEATYEYSLMRELGHEAALTRLSAHRDNFITETHIDSLQNQGIKGLRLPVGYWLFEDADGFAGGGDLYVDRLFSWAEERAMSIVLCFHAAPGSQNGWDHSGRAGDIAWATPNNIRLSYDFLDRLTKSYGHRKALVGIELLNEPHWSLSLETLFEFYKVAGVLVRQNCHHGVSVIVSDSFRPQETLKLLPQLSIDGLILDCHLYQLFTDEDRALDLAGHVKKATGWSRELSRYKRRQPVVVGEWSAAMSELYGPSLQRKRFNYTTDDYVVYVRAQREAFERAGVSWFYWTARTEDRGIWSLLDHPELLSQ